MKSKSIYSTIAVIVVLIIVIALSYERKWLNRILPPKWQKQGFVGAFGRTPGMQNCLAFSGDAKRWSHFNRCTYA